MDPFGWRIASAVAGHSPGGMVCRLDAPTKAGDPARLVDWRADEPRPAQISLADVDVTTDDHDGWCLADADDRPQWLLGIHRTSTLRRALERLGSPRDRSLRELFAEATLVTLPASRDDVADIDTWAELARWAERLEHPQDAPSESAQQEER